MKTQTCRKPLPTCKVCSRKNHFGFGPVFKLLACENWIDETASVTILVLPQVMSSLGRMFPMMLMMVSTLRNRLRRKSLADLLQMHCKIFFISIESSIFDWRVLPEVEHQRNESELQVLQALLNSCHGFPYRLEFILMHRAGRRIWFSHKRSNLNNVFSRILFVLCFFTYSVGSILR